VRIDATSGKILDSLISSNIVRLMQDGTINQALLPVSTGAQSTLLRTSDKVGIGLRNPQQKLHVNGNQCLTNGRMSIGTVTPLAALHVYDDNSSEVSMRINNVGSTDSVQVYNSTYPTFCVTASSNVGVGSAAPAYAVDVVGKVRASAGLRANKIESDGAVIDCSSASLSNLHTVTMTDLVVTNSITIPSAHISSTITNTVYLNTLAPNVGSTTVQMPGAMQITGNDTSLWSSSNYSVGDALGLTQIGLKVNQCILARAMLTTSDVRAKTNIRTKPAAADLQKVLDLPVRTFAYKDDPDVLVAGFIAQDVEAIEPSAVKTTVAPIPSVNKAATLLTQTTVALKNHGIAVGTTLKMTASSEEFVRTVTAVTNDTFDLDSPIEATGDIFVFGEIVNDFKMLDSSRMIPMLFNAIKELNSTIVSLKDRIAVLEGK